MVIKQLFTLVALCSVAPCLLASDLTDRAQGLLDADRPAEAAALLGDVVADGDASAQAHYLFALAQLAQIDQDDIAVIDRMQMGQRGRDHLVAAVEAAPDNLDYRESLLEYYLQAPRMAGGDTQQALQQAAAMLERDARRGTLARARIARYQQDFDLSATLLAAALKQYPADYDLNVDHVLSRLGGDDFEGARAAIAQWQANAPDDPRSDYQLGRLAAVSGRYLEAGQAALSRYLAANDYPTDAPEAYWARLRLAMVLFHARQPAAASKQLAKAESDAPASDTYFAETVAELRRSLAQS